jgi:Myosin N-terminal SH3-like domain
VRGTSFYPMFFQFKELNCSLCFFCFLFQGTPVNIIVGSHVWLEDTATAWVDGKVVKINGQDAEIEASNGKKVILTCNFDSNAASVMLDLLTISISTC